MASKLPDKKSTAQDVQAFIGKVNKAPLVTSDKGRLIFAMDATASREHCWDMASHQHAAMFAEADKVSAISVQLCYYRGFGEFKALPWTRGADEIKQALLSVQCLAGKTQIAKVLAHALSETRTSKVNALVFIGDCVEENPDSLGALAGQLGILNLPLFVFQEGKNPKVGRIFSQLATLSGGAHCQFDQGSARQLGQLLAAVAVYAAGGKSALKSNLLSKDASVQRLLQQIK
ncbi:VWA domain-containing protein [Colwellia sp. C1TZA3]|uniref:VWA domain-containing protein n=1 Tax=Colwellia sp. C1TZA3 TaxID=2508879 RepID=UPI0011B97E6D|nr:VWA domain-containing protein [Colwellia sp. C1TZA3]TWX66522.1 VWA domain-containing protein [Colwellia sp. C1TZA3]